VQKSMGAAEIISTHGAASSFARPALPDLPRNASVVWDQSELGP
jgi:hypothetical protein